MKGGQLGEKVGEKLGEKVGEKAGEKVGESLGEIHKLNLCLFFGKFMLCKDIKKYITRWILLFDGKMDVPRPNSCL